MQQIILIAQEDEHNKFWTAKLSGSNLSVKWGRIGTTGQSKDFAFANANMADRKYWQKIREKRNKGYTEIDSSKLKELKVIASIVGTSNKIIDYKWVEKAHGWYSNYPVSAERLQQPECDAALYVNLQSRSLGDIEIIISNDGVFELKTKKKITESSKWWNLVNKAHEAMANVF